MKYVGYYFLTGLLLTLILMIFDPLPSTITAMAAGGLVIGTILLWPLMAVAMVVQLIGATALWLT